MSCMPLSPSAIPYPDLLLFFKNLNNRKFHILKSHGIECE